MRHTKKAPWLGFCKLGNRVRYMPTALAEWIEAHSAASTSEHDAKKVG